VSSCLQILFTVALEDGFVTTKTGHKKIRRHLYFPFEVTEVAARDTVLLGAF